MNLLVRTNGVIEAIYSEEVDLSLLGEVRIQRASHIEPDQNGLWWAEIKNGPKLGPYSKRSLALKAELGYLINQMEQPCPKPASLLDSAAPRSPSPAPSSVSPTTTAAMPALAAPSATS
jgi:hypothetical protein